MKKLTRPFGLSEGSIIDAFNRNPARPLKDIFQEGLLALMKKIGTSENYRVFTIIQSPYIQPPMQERLRAEGKNGEPGKVYEFTASVCIWNKTDKQISQESAYEKEFRISQNVKFIPVYKK